MLLDIHPSISGSRSCGWGVIVGSSLLRNARNNTLMNQTVCDYAVVEMNSSRLQPTDYVHVTPERKDSTQRDYDREHNVSGKQNSIIKDIHDTILSDSFKKLPMALFIGIMNGYERSMNCYHD